jgi:sugar phosphate isomerase/epimerase
VLSETTSYIKSTGSPEPYLRKIAETGFTHVHRGHQWDTDFLYSKREIEQIRRWLKACGLQMLNLHGSAGVEKKLDLFQAFPILRIPSRHAAMESIGETG